MQNTKKRVMRSSKKICIVIVIVTAFWLDIARAEAIEKVCGKDLVVVVYASGETSAQYEKTVQARIESILKDNGARSILDEAKVSEMKNVWCQLEDPNYFVTDEDFSKNTDQYEINTLARAYLKAEVFSGLADYFSATAQIDLRLVDAQANVTAKNSIPMGAPGCPPSDGLTKSSAIVNAMQRAVDDACIRVGLEVFDLVQPRGIPVRLGVPRLSNGVLPDLPENDQTLWRLANLDNMTWRKEKVTCTARSPGGNMAAVGGYIIETNFHRKPERHYGSRIHILDTKEKREVNAFKCHELGFGGYGTRKVIACSFATNWRYLIAVTGKKVFMWDTQRGCLLDSLEIPRGVVPTSIEFRRIEGINTVVVGARGRRTLLCQIKRKR